MLASYAIDIVIRDIRDMNYNTSKTNNPVLVNLRLFVLKQYIYKMETFAFLFNLAVDNSKKHHAFYCTTGGSLH